MKRYTILCLAALTLAFAPSLRAAEDAKPKPNPERKQQAQDQLKRLAVDLQLTEDQQAKLKPIFAEMNTKMREVRADQALSAEQKREKSTTLRKEYQAKIKEVLTAEQWEKYQKMQQTPRARKPQP